MFGRIRCKKAEYEVCGRDICLLHEVTAYGSFKVPAAIRKKYDKIYRVVGFTRRINALSVKIMSFAESSAIETVDVTCISRQGSIFILPPKIKRVHITRFRCNCIFPKIIIENDNHKFVSTAGVRMIMNHFPLELAYQHSSRKMFFIRETVRFIGDFSFCSNERIKSVVFPSSVEYIGDSSFYLCRNLKFIRFMKNSKLKTLCNCSFHSTAVELIEIPSSTEIIGGYAFFNCHNLRFLAFARNSRLKIIGVLAFESTAIESVDIPSNVEKIGNFTFSRFNNLRKITFQNKSNIQEIGCSVFDKCPVCVDSIL